MPQDVTDTVKKVVRVVCPKCHHDWPKRTKGNTLPVRCAAAYCQYSPKPWGAPDEQFSTYTVTVKQNRTVTVNTVTEIEPPN